MEGHHASGAHAANLEQARAQSRVLVGQQAARDVGVCHLQEVEVRLQPQADALLRQQRPARTIEPSVRDCMEMSDTPTYHPLKHIFLPSCNAQ